MSTCDTCRQPGACCTDIFISRDTWPGTVWADGWKEQAQSFLDGALPGHPFVPHRLAIAEGEMRDPAATAPYGTVFWSCRNLLPSGRCGDYENRPQLCRNYQPGQDAMCVEFKGIPVVVE